MEHIVGATSYFLLSFALGLVAFQFLKSYAITQKSGSRATLGAVLFVLFGSLSAGMGLCAVWRIVPVAHSILSRTAALGMFALFFYAAITGIYLMYYMLPRTTLRIGVLFVPIVIGALQIIFTDIFTLSPSRLHALASQAAFLLLASVLTSFLFVFSRFFVLSRNPEVKIKLLQIMACAVSLFAGMFLSMVVAPLLGFSELISALPAGFLGITYIIITAMPALSSWVHSLKSKSDVGLSSSSSRLAEFLYSL